MNTPQGELAMAFMNKTAMEDTPVSQETQNNNSNFFLLAMVWVEKSKALKMFLVGKDLYMNCDNALDFTFYKVLLYTKFDFLE